MFQAPRRRTIAGLLAGSIITILTWASKAYGGVEIPAEVALAGSTLITFLLQYFIPNPPLPEESNDEA